MIPVTPALEPDDFDTKVRHPGTAFLKVTPNPRARDWGGHDYWRKALGDLLVAYRYICSYSGSWTKPNQSGMSSICDSSVDHFRPKSTTPSQAYEWANFRLARARLNNRKANHNDVIDPFALANRWFVLDFRTFLIIPNRSLSERDKTRVWKTIDRLELNDDDDYVRERIEVIRSYCLGRSTSGLLATHWPFIAGEMRVQNFNTTFLPSMRAAFRSGAFHI